MKKKIGSPPLLPYVLLSIGIAVLFLANALCGSQWIAPKAFGQALMQGPDGTDPISFIVWHIRLPRAATAVLVGAALPVSGLLLQALFRNPVAGPDALGVSSGAGLGVALVLFGQGAFSHWAFAGPWSLALAGGLGAFLATLPMLAMARTVRDPATLLIIGLLWGAVAGALVMLLQFFGPQEALRRYASWGAGGLGGLVWADLGVMALLFVPVLAVSFWLAKPLDALMAGSDYARSLGLPQGLLQQAVAGASALLAGAATAFCGPIAFVGIIVPHLARWSLRTGSHRALLKGTLLWGIALLLLVDTLSHLPGQAMGFPLNALTALVGVPITAWVLLRG
jgi:iron complex transport system permease protein